MVFMIKNWVLHEIPHYIAASCHETLSNINFEFASTFPHNYETSEAGKTHLRSGRQPLEMMPPTLHVYRAEGQRAGGKIEQLPLHG
jgi:hypothetical protein